MVNPFLAWYQIGANAKQHHISTFLALIKRQKGVILVLK
jgi:hypothetical protein